MPNYHPPKNKTIREIGLKNHLNSIGIDYALFTKMVDTNISISGIARFFKRSSNTIDAWKKIYLEEKELLKYE